MNPIVIKQVIEETKQFVDTTLEQVNVLEEKYFHDPTDPVESLQRLEHAHDTLKELNDYLING